MELTKIRNLGDQELTHEEQKAAEQLFRLRFQMKLGQNEGVKKLRDLKKDIARIKTVARERELGLHGEVPKADTVAPKKAAAKKTTGKKKAVARKTVKAGKTKSRLIKPNKQTPKTKKTKKEAR